MTLLLAFSCSCNDFYPKAISYFRFLENLKLIMSCAAGYGVVECEDRGVDGAFFVSSVDFTCFIGIEKLVYFCFHAVLKPNVVSLGLFASILSSLSINVAVLSLHSSSSSSSSLWLSLNKLAMRAWWRLGILIIYLFLSPAM